MKRVIKLTESDLEMIVKRVLNEQLANVIDTPEEIKQIQQKLIDLGYNLGTSGPKKNGVNGIIGNRTKRAIRDFQTKNNIKPTGVLDQTTQNELSYTSKVSKKVDFNMFGRPQKNVKNKKTPTKPPIVKTNDKLQNGVSTDSILSPNIDVKFKNKFNINKLSDEDSTWVCKAGQKDCGTFVNEFTKKLSTVGNAWLAHDIDKAGSRVMSSYTSLSPQQVEKVFDIFKQIENQGGPQIRKSGGQVENIKNLHKELFKPVSASSLKVDDVVGIYYPPSGHHEEAFHQAGKNYFVSDGKGGWKKGGTIQKGKGFGMNTHVGIVGGKKNGVPLIFHNIGGDVYSDPYNKLRDGGKIVWIKRS
jgi:hypothetical protein